MIVLDTHIWVWWVDDDTQLIQEFSLYKNRPLAKVEF